RAWFEYDQPPRPPGVHFIREPHMAGADPAYTTLEERWRWRPTAQEIQASPPYREFRTGDIRTPWIQHHRWAGFELYINMKRRIPEDPNGPPVPGLKTWLIFLPAWFLPSICFVMLSIIVVLIVRRRRSRRAGFCLVCGYDL